MPIYNMDWNRYVPSIFLSCAAEWTIKIWDHNSPYAFLKSWLQYQKDLPSLLVLFEYASNLAQFETILILKYGCE